MTSRLGKAFAWRFSFVWLRSAAQIAVVMGISRLLSPADIGIWSQVMIVTGFALILTETGFVATIVQRPQFTDSERQSALALATLGGIAATLLMILLAPVIAGLFGTPEATPALRAVSSIFIFVGLQATATAMLRRRLDFRSIGIIDLTSYLIGFVGTAIPLALLGSGIWALVFATVVQEATKAVATLTVSRIPLRFELDHRSAVSIAHVGSGMTLTGLVIHLARNLDYLVVGRVLGAEALGIYTRAYFLMQLPITRVSGVLNMVAFSAYAQMHDDDRKTSQGFLRHTGLLLMLVSPLLIALAVFAAPIVRILLGEQWDGAVTPLRVLAIAGIPLGLTNIAETIIRARGAIRVRLILHSAYGAAVLVACYLGSIAGLLGVATGVGLVLTATAIAFTARVLRVTATPAAAYLKTLRDGLIAVAAYSGLAGTIATACAWMHAPDLVVVGVAIPLSLASYGVILLAVLPNCLLIPQESHRQRIAAGRQRLLALLRLPKNRSCPAATRSATSFGESQ